MNMQLKKLPAQVIVLTGATSGIGLATARKAAQRGAKLMLVARNEEALQQLTDELNKQGADTAYVVADVAIEDDVRQIAEAATQRFGRFDTWINNAGVGIFGKNEEISTEDKRRIFDIDFWGVVYGSLTAAKYLKARGGAIINIGSAFSDGAAPLQGIYSAAKHAVKGFTDSLRVELEEEGAPIAVTLVKPASIDTMFVAHAKNYMEVEPKLPPPIYTPDIVADAILYAAEHPVRDLPVGSGAKLIGAAAHYMPRVLDWGMRRFMFKLQKTNTPAHDRDHNSLYRPRQDLLERGGVGGRPRNFSVYTSVVTHPIATRAVMVGAGLALAALWQSRRKAGARRTMPQELRY